MSATTYLFSSESVSEGHPDKICDQISDSVLDAFLRADPQARVACECLATTNFVVVAGEVRGPEAVSNQDAIEEIVRGVARRTGYEQEGFHWERLHVENRLNRQGQEIAEGVDRGGAGDQGMMFGYAVDETPSLMPAPIHYAHLALLNIREARASGSLPGIGPDGKIQLSVEYRNRLPARVDTLVLSHQHAERLGKEDVRSLLEPIVLATLPAGWIDAGTRWHVNPSGSFVRGGPDCDAGLTGRKIIVDTYGGAAPHGGGAFSGKDPTKVDRSGAYAARYLAKNVVAAGLAHRCTIQIAYAIGIAEPVSLMVNTHGARSRDEAALSDALRKEMDITPSGIRDHLKLVRPIYERTAAYGHFGRDPEDDGGFSWERTDLAESLRARFG